MPLASLRNVGAHAVIRAHLPTEEDPGSPKPKQPPPLPDGEVPPAPRGDPPSDAPPERAGRRVH